MIPSGRQTPHPIQAGRHHGSRVEARGLPTRLPSLAQAQGDGRSRARPFAWTSWRVHPQETNTTKVLAQPSASCLRPRRPRNRWIVAPVQSTRAVTAPREWRAMPPPPFNIACTCAFGSLQALPKGPSSSRQTSSTHEEAKMHLVAKESRTCVSAMLFHANQFDTCGCPT